MAAESFLYFIHCICFSTCNAVREVSRILKRPSVRLQDIWGDEHKQGIVGVSRLLYISFATIIDENDQTGTVHTLPMLFRFLISCTILFMSFSKFRGKLLSNLSPFLRFRKAFFPIL